MNTASENSTSLLRRQATNYTGDHRTVPSTTRTGMATTLTARVLGAGNFSTREVIRNHRHPHLSSINQKFFRKLKGIRVYRQVKDERGAPVYASLQPATLFPERNFDNVDTFLLTESRSFAQAKRRRSLGLYVNKMNGSSSLGDRRPASSIPRKRSMEDDNGDVGGERARPRPAPPSGASSSFAARMMAKMGYKPGEGLGASGQGIINPIDVKLRPQGVGLGAVREKTKQAKEEEQRAAQIRGEVLETSSDEERSRRKSDKKQQNRVAFKKPRTRYRTAAEIEAETEGLHVPATLKFLVDLTGREERLLTSTAGLLAASDKPSSTGLGSDALKIAERARRDLEAFAEEWKTLGKNNASLDHRELEIDEELDAEQEKIRRLQTLVDAVKSLDVQEDRDEEAWEVLVSKLERLGIEFRDEIEEYALADVAVAALHPSLRSIVEQWDPLKDPTYLTSHLRQLRGVLGLQGESDDNAVAVQGERKARSTTAYESMMYTIWLPKVRSAVVNDWDMHRPSDLIALMDAWKDLLPPFIYVNLLEQHVVQRLTAALAKWNPKLRHKKDRQAPPHPPHIWLFPWLPYLDAHHLDPKQATGLLSDVKRKFRVVLEAWDVSAGVIDGLLQWKEVLRDEFDHLLLRHLLPRLADHLRSELEINPANQDMQPLRTILRWQAFFRPKVLGQLLLAEFFPKWLEVLHLWLTSAPNYDEVGQWFSWWKKQIPPDVNHVGSVADAWQMGLTMMNQALDLGPRAATDLPPPPRPTATTSTVTPPTTTTTTTTPLASHHPPDRALPLEEDPTTFKDVLESWCAQHDLLLLPLREAHPLTGLPLFRITASARGTGGLRVYLKGDVLWAQSRADRSVWEPCGLDEALVQRAEAR